MPLSWQRRLRSRGRSHAACVLTAAGALYAPARAATTARSELRNTCKDVDDEVAGRRMQAPRTVRALDLGEAELDGIVPRTVRRTSSTSDAAVRNGQVPMAADTAAEIAECRRGLRRAGGGWHCMLCLSHLASVDLPTP